MATVKIKNSLLIILGYSLIMLLVFMLAFMLLIFPEHSGNGIKQGIELCLYTLIPSMYPFMFLSCFIVSSGIIQKSERIFSFVTKKVFGFPGVCGSVILLSMIGGFPIGGKMINEMYNKGLISKGQGQRLMLFCVNPGPAFVITSVGYYMLGSKAAGLIIYASVVLSSLAIGFLSKFLFDDGDNFTVSEYKDLKIKLNESFVSSVTESGRGMLNVCAWVLLFSCVTSLMNVMPLSDNFKTFITAILEVTNGCKRAAGNQSAPILAGIIGFSGLCAQMQIMPFVINLKMPIKYFWASRVINASFAVMISTLLFYLFPVAVETVSLGSVPHKINSELSIPVTIGLMCMCITMLLGENFRVKKRQ